MTADVAKRLHNREEAAAFIGRFTMANLTEDHGASVAQGPHVARPVCNLPGNVVRQLLARKIKHCCTC